MIDIDTVRKLMNTSERLDNAEKEIDGLIKNAALDCKTEICIDPFSLNLPTDLVRKLSDKYKNAGYHVDLRFNQFDNILYISWK